MRARFAFIGAFCPTQPAMDVEAQKRAAAARALEFVQPGMRLGLGTGSTAKHFVDLLGERVAAGLDVIAVPTSEATRAQAERARHCADHARRDAGARSDDRRRRRDRAGPDTDQGRRRRFAAREDRGHRFGPDDRDRRRIQIRCGAWAASRCPSRSRRSARPRPIARSRPPSRRPAAPGRPCCAKRKDGQAFVTDSGHWILDAQLQRIPDPRELAARLCTVPGVMEHGLFIGIAQTVILAGREWGPPYRAALIRMKKECCDTEVPCRSTMLIAPCPITTSICLS